MKISELKNAPEWLILAKTENEDVELHPKYGYVIWKGGTWKGGTWEGGLWKGGTWEGGRFVPMCKWSYYIRHPNIISIGCIEMTVIEWDIWFASDKELSTKRGTEEFKMIQACYESAKAYLNFMNK